MTTPDDLGVEEAEEMQNTPCLNKTPYHLPTTFPFFLS